MKRRVKYGISLAAAALSFCVCLIVLKAWRGPCGFDVYYYALQTRALALTGSLLFSDHSLVYRALYLVNLVLNNPILSVQVLCAFSIALICFSLMMMSFRGGASLYKSAVALIAVFNPATFYLLLEFAKNSFAFALFFLAWLLLTDENNYLSFSVKNRPSLARFCAGLAILAVSVFSHRLMLALFVCFLVHGAFIFLWPRITQSKHGVQTVVLCGIIIAATIAVVCFFLRNMILERISIVSLSAPVHRLTQLFSGDLLPGERVFYIAIQITAFLLIPLVVIKGRQFFKPELVFAAIGWLFLFPFLHFTWDGLGFRLLILAPIMLAPWLMQVRPPFPKAAALVLAVASLYCTVESAMYLAIVKGPDYRAFENTFKSIETYAKGRRVIAHRGLAGFLWYEKGIRSENFLPAGSEDKYLRLVYAFSPEILEPYVQDGEGPPIVINNTYMLIEEKIWQRFYHDRRELYFLKSELNPYLPRPVSGFVINENVAAALSPVSDPP